MKRNQTDAIRDELAGELGVAPGQVVRYGLNDGLYVVLLDDYRKFSVPERPAGAAAAQAADDGDAAATGDLCTEDDIAPQLAKVLEQPHMYDRAVLRRVGALLNIPGAADLNKKPLVRAVNRWKREQEQRSR